MGEQQKYLAPQKYEASKPSTFGLRGHVVNESLKLEAGNHNHQGRRIIRDQPEKIIEDLNLWREMHGLEKIQVKSTSDPGFKKLVIDFQSTVKTVHFNAEESNRYQLKVAVDGIFGYVTRAALDQALGNEVDVQRLKLTLDNLGYAKSTLVKIKAPAGQTENNARDKAAASTALKPVKGLADISEVMVREVLPLKRNFFDSSYNSNGDHITRANFALPHSFTLQSAYIKNEDKSTGYLGVSKSLGSSRNYIQLNLGVLATEQKLNNKNEVSPIFSIKGYSVINLGASKNFELSNTGILAFIPKKANGSNSPDAQSIAEAVSKPDFWLGFSSSLRYLPYKLSAFVEGDMSSKIPAVNRAGLQYSPYSALYKNPEKSFDIIFKGRLCLCADRAFSPDRSILTPGIEAGAGIDFKINRNVMIGTEYIGTITKESLLKSVYVMRGQFAWGDKLDKTIYGSAQIGSYNATSSASDVTKGINMDRMKPYGMTEQPVYLIGFRYRF